MDYMAKHLSRVNTLDDAFLDIALDNIDGLSEEEARYYLENDAIPETGAVSGLINNNDIKSIFSNYYEEIIEKLKKLYGNEIPSDVMLEEDKAVYKVWNFTVPGNDDFIDKTIEKAKELNLIESEDEDEYISEDEDINENEELTEEQEEKAQSAIDEVKKIKTGMETIEKAFDFSDPALQEEQKELNQIKDEADSVKEDLESLLEKGLADINGFDEIEKEKEEIENKVEEEIKEEIKTESDNEKSEPDAEKEELNLEKESENDNDNENEEKIKIVTIDEKLDKILAKLESIENRLNSLIESVAEKTGIEIKNENEIEVVDDINNKQQKNKNLKLK